MGHFKFTSRQKHSIPVTVLQITDYFNWFDQQAEHHQNWLTSSGFQAAPGSTAQLADEKGRVQRLILILPRSDDEWPVQSLPFSLAENGCYELDLDSRDPQYFRTALSWGMTAYCFDRYKKATRKPADLQVEDDALREALTIALEAIQLTRDLVNTPAEDLSPEGLERCWRSLAEQHHAECHVIEGEALIAERFPAIYAVGRASEVAPRLLELNWGDLQHPKLTLVGKGVCFDTGGLDLKPPGPMRNMKKDMGGAAHVMGLAQMIMRSGLPVRLKVLVPAVENSIGSRAYRPGDVINTRRGLTVEIGNTDAEGRLVLADALSYACEESPELIIDFATLTGAARIALGADLPAVFCNSDREFEALYRASQSVYDPLWRMPLHAGYRSMLASNIADLSNIGNSSFAGSITAALFLNEFVDKEIPWIHIDVFAWNERSLPSRPKGGEAFALRAVFEYIKKRFPRN